MPGSGSRRARVTARSLSLALLALVVSQAPRACLAGESFLSDNAKAPGAVLYGRTIDEIALPTPTAPAGRAEEAERQDAGPPAAAASSPDESIPGQDSETNRPSPAE